MWIALQPLKKYAVFSGRARRKEYWLYYLLATLATVAALLLDAALGTYDLETGYGPISGILLLGTVLPGLAVSVRRMHDLDRSGWWLLICLLPLIGSIILFVFLCQDGTPGDNRYGTDPKNRIRPQMLKPA